MGTEVITLENIHWVGFIFWLLTSISFISLMIGVYRKSGLQMSLSSITIFPMAGYLWGANNWFRLAILIPVVLLAVALFFRKNEIKNK